MPLSLVCCSSSPAARPPHISAASSPPSPAHMSDVSFHPRGGKPVVDHAVIIGGGLGGLAAALHLRKVGIDAQVYEKSSTVSGGEGTLISLFPNGCKALNEASPEVLQKMRSVGILNSPSSLLFPDGKKFGEWSLSTQMEEKYGQPLISIMWKDALKILSEALPEDCKHFGYECIDVTQEDYGAVAHFKKEDETVSIKAPLVIGADGIRSAVRAACFGNIPPRDNGRTMWRAVIDMDCCSNEGLEIGSYASSFNGRTVFIVNGVQGKLYWAFSVDDDYCEGSTKIRSKTPEEAKERLLGYYEGFSLATAIIQATEPELILERRVLDLPVLSTWFQGSTVLLGDSVHAVTPSLGQGANIAFEDGMQLAKLLTSCADLRSAFEEYQAKQIPRARKVSKQSQDKEGKREDDFYDWLYNPEMSCVNV
eukprot:c4394_g1_i1 orf=85-1353(+)